MFHLFGEIGDLRVVENNLEELWKRTADRQNDSCRCDEVKRGMNLTLTIPVVTNSSRLQGPEALLSQSETSSAQQSLL